MMVFLALAFSSCKKEDALETQNNNNISRNKLKSFVNQVKVWHDTTINSYLTFKVQNSIKSMSVNTNDIAPPIIDWEKAFKNYDSSDVISITIPISMNYKNGEHMELVATKSKTKLNGYLIKVTPDSTYFANQIDMYNYTDFSGLISIYNLMGVRLKKQDFKTGIVTNSKNYKIAFSNNITYDSSPPCEGCDLLTVTVYNSLIKKYQFGGYNYGLIYIDYQQNLQLDELGGGDVIAGGSNIDYDLMAVPDGQCVFGALAHLGSLLSGNSNANDYINQWAKKQGIDFDKMNLDLINNKEARPNTKQSIELLNDNYYTKNLIDRNNMLLEARVSKKPIFVLINWGNGNGHNIIVKWSDKYNKLVFYDPIENLDDKPYEGSFEFYKSTHFYAVYEPR